MDGQACRGKLAVAADAPLVGPASSACRKMLSCCTSAVVAASTGKSAGARARKPQPG